MILSLSDLRHDFKVTYRNHIEVAKKLDLLIEITKVELSHQSPQLQARKRIKLLELVHAAKTSPRTIQRWKRNYLDTGVISLFPSRKGRPKRKHLEGKITNLISYYRKEFRWGSEVIQAHLLRDYGHKLSRYQIDRYLTESGLKDEFPCTTKKKSKRKKKRHTKKVKVHHPGEHTQMDVKYQLDLLGDGTKAYVYNFVDHASNWSFKMAYSSFTASNTKDFMERLIQECPFKINRIQTDNGIEFTFKWTSKHADDPKEHPLLKFCHKWDIVHKLIPPGEKELQGLVERSHRQDDQELFSRIKPFDIDEFNSLLSGYWKFRNRGRRFKKLDWESPDIWLENYLIQFFSQIIMINERWKSVDKSVA